MIFLLKLILIGNNPMMTLTLSWRRPLSYRNQSIDLLRKSVDWFLYDNGLHHDRTKYCLEGIMWLNEVLFCMNYLMKLVMFGTTYLSACFLTFPSDSIKSFYEWIVIVLIHMNLIEGKYWFIFTYVDIKRDEDRLFLLIHHDIFNPGTSNPRNLISILAFTST